MGRRQRTTSRPPRITTATAILGGRPVLSRSIWYDLDGTMLVVDWGEAVESHEYATSFTIPGTTTTSNLPAGRIQSTNAGGNVKIQSLLQTGQAAFRQTAQPLHVEQPAAEREGPRDAVLRDADGHVRVLRDADHRVRRRRRRPNITATLLSTPAAGQPVQIRLNKNGAPQDITFTPPALKRLNTNATIARVVQRHRVRLRRQAAPRVLRPRHARPEVHRAQHEREVVDRRDDRQRHASSASTRRSPIDGNNRVGVAYTNANNGDLKYAFHNGSEWNVETVDCAGLDRALPVARLQPQQRRRSSPTTTRPTATCAWPAPSTGGWSLTTLDAGQIGTKDVGRFSHLVLDPSRPDASKWAIAYEDTGGGRYRYAIQGNLLGGEQTRRLHVLQRRPDRRRSSAATPSSRSTAPTARPSATTTRTAPA